MATNFPTSVDVLTNPVSNDSLNSPSHSAQHSNANDAIEAIEGYLLNGGQGLTLVKKQSIGTAVSSVSVSDAFSATYENYKIIVSGGAGSTPNNLILSLNGATSGYYESLIFATYAGGVPTNAPVNNGSNWAYSGDANANSLTMNVDLLEPFAVEATRMSGEYITLNNSGHFAGYQSTVASYTGFSVTPTSGTITGGTIYVYGYGKGQ